MSALSDPTRVDFETYVTARGAGLLRFAYVLTANEADAQDIVQDALSRALPRWSRIMSADDPDAYVRRMVVNAHVSWWRKVRRREAPAGNVAPPGHAPVAADAVIARGLASLRTVMGERDE
ncbi:putative RNA polymerase sigma factor [Alloactinosynnema sp. L-07]|nr:putative RNA polymerase sigma factor [Alloactinosynnema sp. L-07]